MTKTKIVTIFSTLICLTNVAFADSSINPFANSNVLKIEFQKDIKNGDKTNKYLSVAPGYLADYGDDYNSSENKSKTEIDSPQYNLTFSGWYDLKQNASEDFSQYSRFRGTGSVQSNPDGLNYSVVSELAPNPIVSNSALSQKYKTLIHMEKPGTDAAWKIQLPAGKYHVKFVVGDPYYTDALYGFEVNEVPVKLAAYLNTINPATCDSTGKNCELNLDPSYSPNYLVSPVGCSSHQQSKNSVTWDCSNSRIWFDGEADTTVTASDSTGMGTLMVSNHFTKTCASSYNNKLDYIEITQTSAAAPSANLQPVILYLPTSLANVNNAETLFQGSNAKNQIAGVVQANGVLGSTSKIFLWNPDSTGQYRNPTDLDPTVSFSDLNIANETALALNDNGDVLGVINNYLPTALTPQSELAVWVASPTGIYTKQVLPSLPNDDLANSFAESGELMENGDVVGDIFGDFTDVPVTANSEAYFRATVLWKRNSNGTYQAPVRLSTTSIPNMYYDNLATTSSNGNIYANAVFLPNYSQHPIVWVKNSDGSYGPAIDISVAAGNVGSDVSIYQSSITSKYLIGSKNELLLVDYDQGFNEPQYFLVNPTANGASYGPGVPLPLLNGLGVSGTYVASLANQSVFEASFTTPVLADFTYSTANVFSSQNAIPYTSANYQPLNFGESVNDSGVLLFQSLGSALNYIEYPVNQQYTGKTAQLPNPSPDLTLTLSGINDQTVIGQGTFAASGGAVVSESVMWFLNSSGSTTQNPCLLGTVADTITNGDFNSYSTDYTGQDFGDDLKALITGNLSWDVFSEIPGWYTDPTQNPLNLSANPDSAHQIELWGPDFGGDTQNAPGTNNQVGPLDGSITMEVKGNGPGSVYQDFCASGLGDTLTFQLYARTGQPYNSELNILVDGVQLGQTINATTTAFVTYKFYIPPAQATAGMHILQLQAPSVAKDPLPSYGVDIRHVKMSAGQQ
jgi:hypothetical protein